MGEFDNAAHEYRLFIADALAEIALDTMGVGEYSKAAPLFDEALELAPRSPGLEIRYGQAALAAHDLTRARTLAETVLREYPDNPKAREKAHLLLGKALTQLNHEVAAIPHFEAALAIDPNFDNGYALAVAYLDEDDDTGAAKIFSEMISGLGDTAELHVAIGRAYLNSDFQQAAIPEFQTAITKNVSLVGAHYELAIAYLTIGGDANVEKAKIELEAELRISPNDASTHAQLGNIALRQQRYPDAEKELKLAESLDRADPNAPFYLGQFYAEMSHNNEAIAAFQRSISLTTDPSQNRFQVQKAHYQLGRLLIQQGQNDAGRKEMQISSVLIKESLNKDRNRLAGDSGDSTPKPVEAIIVSAQRNSREIEAIAALEGFQMRLGPALSDSYNNLGVITASQGHPREALVSFERAYEWNPRLPGLDKNWGLAAFQSGRYAEAIPALSRLVDVEPSNVDIRSALAISLFKTGDFGSALKTLEPILTVVASVPQLEAIHAVSLIRTGQQEAGLEQLQALTTNGPRDAEFHTLVGEAYENLHDFARAKPELVAAIRLAPERSDAYVDLASINLSQNNVDEAIHNLNIAARLNPTDTKTHETLAQAYRKKQRQSDADHEEAIYRALLKDESRQRGTSLP